MSLFGWINQVSLPVFFLITIAFVALSIFIGSRLGVLVKKHTGESPSIGSAVGAILGLLAFMLAFTFNMAANRFDARKQLYVDHISSMGTTYLRADLLEDEQSARVKTLLREYADILVKISQDHSSVDESVASADVVLGQLWSVVDNIAASRDLTKAENLFVQSLNEMIDLQGKRVIVVLHFKVPEPIWLALFSISALAMLTVGYQFSFASKHHILVALLLVVAFSTVIVLIADLDRGREGTLQVDQQALMDLHKVWYDDL